MHACWLQTLSCDNPCCHNSNQLVIMQSVPVLFNMQQSEGCGGVQACWRAITAKLFCSVITFKATAKGPGKLGNSAFRDLWLPGLSFIVLMISVVSYPSLSSHVCNIYDSVLLQVVTLPKYVRCRVASKCRSHWLPAAHLYDTCKHAPALNLCTTTLLSCAG